MSWNLAKFFQSFAYTKGMWGLDLPTMQGQAGGCLICQSPHGHACRIAGSDWTDWEWAHTAFGESSYSMKKEYVGIGAWNYVLWASPLWLVVTLRLLHSLVFLCCLWPAFLLRLRVCWALAGGSRASFYVSSMSGSMPIGMNVPWRCQLKELDCFRFYSQIHTCQKSVTVYAYLGKMLYFCKFEEATKCNKRQKLRVLNEHRGHRKQPVTETMC